jgi:putative holliday junction resolvase
MSMLSIDFGEKRIGLAKSDELNMFAHSLGVIYRISDSGAIEQIKKLMREERLSKVLIGLPKNMSGIEGPQAKRVRDFGAQLIQESELELIFWDERLTTSQAERALVERDRSRGKRKLKRDTIAAELILQNYLDYLKIGK